MRNACLSGDFVHRIGQFFRSSPQLFPDRPVFRLEQTGENQFLHVIHRNIQFLEQAVHRFGNDFGIAFFPEPPLFPGVVELGFGSPVMIHEIVGEGVGTQELRHNVFIPNQDRRRAVAEPHFVKAGRTGLPFVGRGHQNGFSAPRFDDIQSGQESGRAGPLARRKIRRIDVAPQIQSRGQNAGILAIQERQARGAQVSRIDFCFVFSNQTIHGRGDGHRQAVLIVIAHGTFALGHTDKRRSEPAHRLINSHSVQSQAGNIGSV